MKRLDRRRMSEENKGEEGGGENQIKHFRPKRTSWHLTHGRHDPCVPREHVQDGARVRWACVKRERGGV